MTTATTRHSDRRISPVFLGIVAVTAVTGWATWTGFAERTDIAVFLFVTGAWIVSLCLHEYAHARTALHSGDISIGAKGYLTLNPLAYTHALLSIVLPVIFVIMGGIGLPGGAVFIERDRIRGRWRHSLISAAGPLTNVLFAIACTAPFWLDALDGVPLEFRIIEPWLSHDVKRQIEPFAPFGLLFVFALLWVPQVNGVFFDLVHSVLNGLGVSEAEASIGWSLYRFW